MMAYFEIRNLQEQINRLKDRLDVLENPASGIRVSAGNAPDDAPIDLSQLPQMTVDLHGNDVWMRISDGEILVDVDSEDES